MFPILKQFVPSKVCLACDGCCRFSDAQSCWRPKVTKAEIQAAALPGKKGTTFPHDVIDSENAIRTIPNKDLHICYFLQMSSNACGIYPHRPLECQLYPFILTGDQKQLKVNVHLACPYVQKYRNTPDFVIYVEELKIFFRQKATLRFLEGYLPLSHAYPGFELELEEIFSVEGMPAG